ncbi:putative Holliday junction resolvase [Symbiodinium microadriaticum]|uniref:Putative Holliday junction resolvase n=1 Tax=Symbiodinium microadriaticum TaxID=2951 RepID=A0A1Q9EGD9_SYMMI|nr:putative Holliday junction resolvase [Symbiodinium microadriaticum]
MFPFFGAGLLAGSGDACCPQRSAPPLRGRAPRVLQALGALTAATVTSHTFAGLWGSHSLPPLRDCSGLACRAESQVQGTGVSQENFETPEWRVEGLSGRKIPKGFDTWTDYTRYAVESIKVHGPVGPSADEAKNPAYRPISLVDRKRSMGVDFGPSFCGMAMSLGGVNTMPMGTLRTGQDWKQLAIKIVKIASTYRIKDIVVGQPLQKDGSEGRIGKLVRYFVQILADTCLLMLGNEVTVFMWDERFSTQYAAMRLANKPRFDGSMFKKWITAKIGMNWGAKGLLDSEAARAILEHWLSKDENTEIINKELSERIAPSRQACIRYLKYRKVRAMLPEVEEGPPEEPAGPGKEGWEWYDRHPGSYDLDEDSHERAVEAFRDYMGGLDGFGDKEYEFQKREDRRAKNRADNERVKAAREQSAARQAFRDAAAAQDKKFKGMELPKERWSKYR